MLPNNAATLVESESELIERASYSSQGPVEDPKSNNDTRS